MNELQKFSNGIFNLDVKVDGENILFSAEQAAKAMGITQVKNGKEYVKWERVNSYLPNSPEVGKGSFISEPMVYKLAFKANNAVSEKFTDWLAVDVLPTIRKHGAYMTEAKASQVRIPTSQRELVQLALSANEETNQRVDEIDDRLTDIEMNKLITTEDKGTIDAHVRKKVHSICKDFKLEQKAKSMLFQELGSSIKKLFNVPNRGRLKDKDFMSALEFIDSWQPSSVTKAQIKQLDLF